jgi:hypothetical protein
LLFDSASLKDLATTTLPDLAAADRRFLVFIANFSSKFHFQREHLTTKLTGKIKMQSEAAQLYFVRVQRLVMPCPSLQSQP